MLVDVDMGDVGFVDIVGRKYGKLKLLYNSDKLYIGFVVFFMLVLFVFMVYVINFKIL